MGGKHDTQTLERDHSYIMKKSKKKNPGSLYKSNCEFSCRNKLLKNGRQRNFLQSGRSSISKLGSLGIKPLEIHVFTEYMDYIFPCQSEALVFISATAQHTLQSQHCAADRKTLSQSHSKIYVSQLFAQSSKVISFTPCLHHKKWDQDWHHSTWDATFQIKYGPGVM